MINSSLICTKIIKIQLQLLRINRNMKHQNIGKNIPHPADIIIILQFK